MNIVFVSEQGFVGKVPRDFKNMRTEYGWMSMLDAFHIPYFEVRENSSYSTVIETADLIVFIPSKKNPELLRTALAIKNIPIAIMQEGPNYLWQDWGLEHQLLYLAIIKQVASIVFVHNEKDKEYFQGLTKKPVIVLRTVMHTSDFKDWVHQDERKSKVFIGGNMCSWYGGMNSYLTVMNSRLVTSIGFPSMGRKQSMEEILMKQVDGRIEYLPYLEWADFMSKLNEYGIGIHLMPTAAAGSFSLNCAMLGIPCIGNKDDDTQRLLFPDLSIDVTRVDLAKELLDKLLTDESFYSEVTKKALYSLKDFDIEEQREKYLETLKNTLNKS